MPNKNLRNFGVDKGPKLKSTTNNLRKSQRDEDNQS